MYLTPMSEGYHDRGNQICFNTRAIKLVHLEVSIDLLRIDVKRNHVFVAVTCKVTKHTVIIDLVKTNSCVYSQKVRHGINFKYLVSNITTNQIICYI